MITCPKTHRPDSKLAEISALFNDDHVHMALVVAWDGRLITTIERADLSAARSRETPAPELGTLVGRTVGPAEPLAATTAALSRQGRRRVAVVGESGRLLGLLCLKRDGTGSCTDEDIRARASGVQKAPARAGVDCLRP
jgi:CBS-domain-containing membrane protein